MSNNKKGISLIVLIITIIVIIILAGAVILSLNNTSIIDNSNKAVLKQNLSNVQDAVTLYIANNSIVGENYGKVVIGAGTIGKADLDTTATVTLPDGTSKKLTYTVLGIDAPSVGSFSVSDKGLVSSN